MQTTKKQLEKNAPRARVQFYNINFDRLYAYALAQVGARKMMENNKEAGRPNGDEYVKVSKSPMRDIGFGIKHRDPYLINFLPNNLVKRRDGKVVGSRVPTITNAMLTHQPGSLFKDPRKIDGKKPNPAIGFNPLIHFIPTSMHLFTDDKDDLFGKYSTELGFDDITTTAKVQQSKKLWISKVLQLLPWWKIMIKLGRLEILQRLIIF